MNKLTYTIIILSIFITNQLHSSSLLKRVEKSSKPKEKTKTNFNTNQKKKYNLEEVTDILKLSKLITFNLSHDINVYNCMKIAKNAVDLDGAIFVLIASKTNLGDALDDNEVDLIIDISKVNTEIYQEIMTAAQKIGKNITTVKEHHFIIDEIKKENGKNLLSGIELATACKYKIENDYFSSERLDLLVKIGKLKDQDRFIDIYEAMKKVGMDDKINTKALEIIYKLYNLKGDVAYQIAEYLKANKWKSRKQPGEREYTIVRDMMNTINPENDEKATDNKPQVVKTKPIAKKINKTKKIKKKKRKKKKDSNNPYDACSEYIPKK